MKFLLKQKARANLGEADFSKSLSELWKANLHHAKHKQGITKGFGNPTDILGDMILSGV